MLVDQSYNVKMADLDTLDMLVDQLYDIKMADLEPRSIVVINVITTTFWILMEKNEFKLIKIVI